MFTIVIFCTILLSGLSSSLLLFPEYRSLGERATPHLSSPIIANAENGLRNHHPLASLLNTGPPVKRSAMLINKFMRDIQRSLDQAQQEVSPQVEDPASESEAAIKRKFSRCYLNAASCFI